jgi:membrane protein YdbS with pleckstrin-like domain
MKIRIGDHVERASRWIYHGIWGVLVRWFKVPDHPPELPLPPGETLDAFRPAEGFLRYLQLWFWIGLVLIDGAIAVGWVAIAVASPSWGAILALPALALAVLPDIVVYIAIHLQYDTTWYVMTGRSLRIRRGIWTIHETTITFENVQNVEVNQGPVQRVFGIADVRVDTAGGGGGRAAGHDGQSARNSHRGLIEGVSNAHEIRDLILARLHRSRSAGLGDENPAIAAGAAQWSARQVAALREIHDLMKCFMPG